MIQAGVREMKDRLSEYLRRVRRGERVVITDRGRPVAVLVAIGEEATEEAAWALVRKGLGAWSGGKPAGLAHPPRIPGRRAEEVVIEDRR
jgi:prevent-host-death family protein